MEDLQNVLKPVYLADCLRLLRDTENPDSTEAALSVIDQIIRRKPDDLEERAIDLSQALLFLTNIHSDEYQQMRIDALITLCSFSVSNVVPFLTNQFYGINHNIQNRLDILKILSHSAQNLSNNKYQDDINHSTNTDKQNDSSFEVLSEFASDGFRKQSVGSMVRVRYHPSIQLSKNIEEHTRRWSSLERRNAAKSKSFKNNFDTYCGLFFFPLLKDYDNPKYVQ